MAVAAIGTDSVIMVVMVVMVVMRLFMVVLVIVMGMNLLSFLPSRKAAQRPEHQPKADRPRSRHS